MVEDAGSAQHLTVEVIDQSQKATRLHPKERLTSGAFKEILQASTPGVTKVLFLFCVVHESLKLGLYRGGQLWGVTAGWDGR